MTSTLKGDRFMTTPVVSGVDASSFGRPIAYLTLITD